MNTLDDIAREQPAPAADEEEKKRKKKRNLLVGLAALAVIGGSAVCVGTGIVDKLKPGPEPQPTETVAVRVEPTNTAYAPLPTATAVTLSPTPTTAAAYDVREGWYGSYRGTASGNTTNHSNGYYQTFEGTILWLEIREGQYCYLGTPTFCDENLSWGARISYTHNDLAEAVAQIWLYLPENLSDAPNLTITEDFIRISTTEDHPYELIIEKVDGHVKGSLRTTGRPLEQWMEVTDGVPEIEYFEAHEATWDEFPFKVTRSTP